MIMISRSLSHRTHTGTVFRLLAWFLGHTFVQVELFYSCQWLSRSFVCACVLFLSSSSSSRSISYSSLALASYCARVEVAAALFFFSSASALASTSALISSTLTSQVVEHVQLS